MWQVPRGARCAQLARIGLLLSLFAFLLLLACAIHPAAAFGANTSGSSDGLTAAEVADDSDQPEPVENVPLYRLYNGFSGEHFYTLSEKEKDSLVKAGWFYEGVGWQAPATSNTPVYRLYNPKAGDHHYTTSAKERDGLKKVGWKDEGIGWYSVDADDSDDGNVSAANEEEASNDAEILPVYRQYNSHARTGTHNFTYSKNENDNLVKAGWKAEGIAWYASGPGESATMTWFSKTHLLALATCIGGGGTVTPGYNTTIDPAKLNRLKRLVDTDVEIAFVAVNARNGKSVAYHADWRFYSASTIKAPYVAALCRYDAPGLSNWIGTMEDVIQWSSNEGFNTLVSVFGLDYEDDFAQASNVDLTHPYGGAYTDLTPRELAKLWINIRSFVISSETNSGLFRSLFEHKYYKEGWMYWGMLGGQVYHVGGIDGDVVYAIMTRYQYEDQEVWDIKNAIVSALS